MIPFVSSLPESGRRAERAIWTGQNGNGIPNDCGPAAVRGFLTWLDRAPALTVADIARVIDGPLFNGTTARDCGEYLRRQGLTPVYGSACKAAPFVALVDYVRLPLANRLDQTGRTFKHWITVTAIDAEGVTYNDPYHPDAARGAGLRMTHSQFNVAESGIWYRWSVRERPAAAPDPGIGSGADEVAETVYIQPETNVRASKSTATAANILGESAKTWLQVQAVREPAIVEGFAWWRIALQPVWPAGLFALEKQRPTTATAYVRADRVRKTVPVVTPPTPTPTPPVGKRPDIGVSVLNAHHLLEPAYQLGLRSFLIMNGIQKTREFKLAHPDAYVMARRYMQPIGQDYLPELNSGEMRELQTIGHGITVVSPVNEGDIWPQGPKPGKTAREVIQKRAEFDYRMAVEVRKNGGFYAGGSFSMGEPDYTNPEICDAMREFYAPHYNSGLMGINYHSYSPNPLSLDATDGRHIWHEDRWRFLFERCGFMNVDNPVGIVCDETGLDQGGVGGVPAHGLNGSFVEQWTRKTKARWSSIVIQGKPAPIRHATWFQAGDNRSEQGGWAGFNIEWYLADIARGNA